MSDYDVPAAESNAPRSLPAMRVRYTPGPLLETDVDASPFVQVRRWLDDALAAQLPEPNAMVLSTASPDGGVSSRHVLLKELDEVGFVFYTNLASRKATQLAQNPVAALCFPWFAMSRQLCVEGRVTPLDRGTVATYWAQRPRESQLGAWASEQSAPVGSRATLHSQLAAVQARFTDGAVPVPEQWGGFRVVPHRIELWQGQPGRLHDRLVYRQAGDTWTLSRLQP